MKKKSLIAAMSVLPSLLVAQSFRWIGSSTIPDDGCNNGVELTLDIPVTNVGVMNAAEELLPSIYLVIDHSYVSDLVVKLRSPQGTEVMLTNGNGGSGVNVQVWLVPWAGTMPIAGGTPPYMDYFAPDGDLGLFDGQVADGTWQVVFCDDASVDVGTVEQVTLKFNSSAFLVDMTHYFPVEGNTNNEGANGGVISGIGNPTLGPDRHLRPNQAMDLDGSTYYISNGTDFAPDDGLTLAAWIKPENVSASTDAKVISMSAGPMNINNIMNLGIYNGQVDFELVRNGGQVRLTGPTVVSGEWIHIAGIWTDNDNAALYVNGEQVDMALANSSPNFGGNPTPLTIGAAAWDPANLRFNGAIDEVRVYSYAMGATALRNAVIAHNNWCGQAYQLDVVGDSCTELRRGYNVQAYDAAGPTPSCASHSGGDSWFKITVPASGRLTVETSTTGSPLVDTGLELYTGDCGNLSAIECNDDQVPGSNYFSKITQVDLTPGSDVYARVWSYGNNTIGSFGICAYEHPSLVGMDEATGRDAIVLYPNPTAGLVTLRCEQLVGEQASIQVMDLSGRILHVEEKNALPAVSTLDLSGWTDGSYLVRIANHDEAHIARLVLTSGR
ncbi:MAG: T9SS type A sorting domain-containing protein [Flavobacteriales bacterium]|nr:T9SS type A sorting domain-containing protein [Flavobacteriales bacterium]